MNSETKPIKPCFLFQVLGKTRPQKLHLATYTLSREVALELNKYARYGDVVVCAAKLPPDTEPFELNYRLHVTPWNHAKIWVVDSRTYVGSTNLVSDTIVNLMVEVGGRPARRARELLSTLFNHSKHKCQTLLV